MSCITWLGPFDLLNQNRYFGGWPSAGTGRHDVAMAFPVEGWQSSAAVLLRQRADGGIDGTVAGTPDPDAAFRQALAVLSLDVDGTGYPEVGRADPAIGGLQRDHNYLRPVLFHSPYEAACAFVLGHRLRIAQGRAIRQRIAERHGDQITVAGVRLHSFPTPQRLLELHTVPGVSEEKMRRLHGIARAALDGDLDRRRLRELPAVEALGQVRRLRGIGEFFAAGIVLRGAGVVDAVPDERITRTGIERLYQLPSEPDRARIEAITASWRPYRMWCAVLLQLSERRRPSKVHGGRTARTQDTVRLGGSGDGSGAAG
ncbi:MAG TPA: DNA-3-methyladenine glycosylase 2 family protein [Actinophytocola sp.]|uniref:DNA-3-methyladenine glycosylase family protein n=1 Tax=Actinophytocola sp. TaxID=1872138 RepID=UPI002F9253C7